MTNQENVRRIITNRQFNDMAKGIYKPHTETIDHWPGHPGAYVSVWMGWKRASDGKLFSEEAYQQQIIAEEIIREICKEGR